MKHIEKLIKNEGVFSFKDNMENFLFASPYKRLGKRRKSRLSRLRKNLKGLTFLDESGQPTARIPDDISDEIFFWDVGSNEQLITRPFEILIEGEKVPVRLIMHLESFMIMSESYISDQKFNVVEIEDNKETEATETTEEEVENEKIDSDT